MYKKVSELKGGETIRFKGSNIALENIIVKVQSNGLFLHGQSVKSGKYYGGRCNINDKVFVYGSAD